MKKNRESQRQAASRGQQPNFAVEDYVMVAKVRWPGSTPKLVSTWTSPWRIVTADKMHVYGLQSTVTGEVKDVHVVRLRFYTDKDLEMTVALNEMFQHPFTEGMLEIVGIVDISEAEEGQVFDVNVDWVGLDEGQRSWKPLAIIWDGALQFVESELRKLRIDRGVSLRLRKLYGITLYHIGAYIIVKLV